jgi:ribosomal protein L37AE/L43A
MDPKHPSYHEIYSDIWDNRDKTAPRCPYCDRVMSNREEAEQGACNDCYEAQTGREHF